MREYSVLSPRSVLPAAAVVEIFWVCEYEMSTLSDEVELLALEATAAGAQGYYRIGKSHIETVIRYPRTGREIPGTTLNDFMKD